MRIDSIKLKNFKKFEDAEYSFDRVDEAAPDFHVIIGNNGAGKTTILDAIAIGLGVWLEKVPDSLLENSRRRLTADQKTVIASKAGDRIQPQQKIGDTSLILDGKILDENIDWGLPFSCVARVSSAICVLRVAAGCAKLQRLWD